MAQFLEDDFWSDPAFNDLLLMYASCSSNQQYKYHFVSGGAAQWLEQWTEIHESNPTSPTNTAWDHEQVTRVPT